MAESALVHDGDNDYRLDGASAWTLVSTVVAYVRNTGTGLRVEIYPNTPEFGEIIDELYVPFPVVTEDTA